MKILQVIPFLKKKEEESDKFLYLELLKSSDVNYETYEDIDQYFFKNIA